MKNKAPAAPGVSLAAARSGSRAGQSGMRIVEREAIRLSERVYPEG